MNIFLIGYRCTGKTTVGKILAGHLGWSFVDTDQMVVEITGMAIARLVGESGWRHFRKQERNALETACANKNQVVGTGGGIVLDARNRLAMKNAGNVVWLRASEKTIQTRMLGDETTAGNRPSLTGQGPLEEISTVLAERLPLYEEAADMVVDTDRKTIAEICKQIMTESGINVNNFE